MSLLDTLSLSQKRRPLQQLSELEKFNKYTVKHTKSNSSKISSSGYTYYSSSTERKRQMPSYPGVYGNDIFTSTLLIRSRHSRQDGPNPVRKKRAI